MAVRQVLKMGDPLLFQVAEPVREFDTPQLDALIADMFDTMAALNGAGLAAPQIGVSQRIAIFGKETEEGWKGCLSVPGMRGIVRRYTKLRYSGFDQRGRPVAREASGFHARVVQHECDHLDGILYPMRIKDMRLFGYEDVLFPGQ